MQIVVVSDSHGRNEVFAKIRQLHPNASAYLCCGDTECDDVFLDGFVTVLGNNDYGKAYPHHLIIDLGEIRIYMTHGDRIPRLGMMERFAATAKAENCALFLFGHTHIFEVVEEEGVTIVNPGSIYHNRDGSLASYALITVEDGRIEVERKAIDEPRKAKKSWFI